MFVLPGKESESEKKSRAIKEFLRWLNRSKLETLVAEADVPRMLNSQTALRCRAIDRMYDPAYCEEVVCIYNGPDYKAALINGAAKQTHKNASLK